MFVSEYSQLVVAADSFTVEAANRIVIVTNIRAMFILILPAFLGWDHCSIKLQTNQPGCFIILFF